MHKTLFDRLSTGAAHAVGHRYAFAVAFTVVIGWGLAGPFFGWSEAHQLFINTMTTIVTFLMVFLIQSSQNRDTQALQTKLDALVKASEASNAVCGMEDMPEKEQQQLKEHLR